MAAIASCALHKQHTVVYPRISLTDFLARLGDISDIKSKIRHYEMYDQEQVHSTEEITRKYIPIKKGKKWYRFYSQNGCYGSESYAYRQLKHFKCPYFGKPKMIIEDAEDLDIDMFFIPHYNEYCRTTLRPYVKTVMRQLLKVLVCLRKRVIVHLKIRPESITWRWNKRGTKPHIYLTNFDQIEDGDRSVQYPYIYDWAYDDCEYDVRLAGVLMLEMLLDRDIFPLYSNTNCLIPLADREQFYAQIGCPVTCDLLEELIGGSPIGRITAKEALKHEYFKSKL